MTVALITWFTFFLTMWWCCPRLFLLIDRHVARQHSRRFHASSLQRRSSPSKSKRTRKESRLSLSDYALSLDELARHTRTQISGRDALIGTLPQDETFTLLRQQLSDGEDISQSLAALTVADPNTQEFVHFLQLSFIHQSFSCAGLEQAAIILRDRDRLHQEMQVSSAQAMSSARLLTLLPIGFLCMFFIFSQDARSSFLHSSAIILLIGILINRLGWLWMKSLVRRATNSPRDIVSQLADALAIALPANVPLQHAIEDWAAVNDEVLHQDLTNGTLFEDAVTNFGNRQESDAHVLTRTIISAHRDGLPVRDTVHQLSTEMRQRQRHAAETRIRRLSNTLILPVVLCVLPSFIFLTVIPLALANFSQFHFALPSTSISHEGIHALT